MSDHYDTVVNRNRHYGKTDNSLRVPLSQNQPPSPSNSFSRLNLFTDQPSSTSPPQFLGNCPIDPNLPHENLASPKYHSNSDTVQAPQTVNWSHNSHTTFSAIANNELIDPNVVMVPKHPVYLSKLFRPNPKEIASQEAFSTIRVETIALCCLFIVLAAVFTVDYWAIILMSVAACILCFIGFIGALRNIRALIYVYWVGFMVWVGLVVVIAFVALLASNLMKNAAITRCESDKAYVQKYNVTEYGAQIDCAVNTYFCLQSCIKDVQNHLTLAYFLLGGLVLIFFLIYFLRGQQLLKQLIFVTKDEHAEESTSRNDSSDSSDDSEPEDFANNNPSTLQQQQQQQSIYDQPSALSASPRAQSHQNAVRFVSNMQNGDLIVPATNPLHPTNTRQ